jgi:hypothetical protein
MQFYIDETREPDPYALPDGEAFELTAEEAAQFLEEDTVWQYLKDYPLATMNSRDRGRMIDAMVADGVLSGGWFARVCFPGCLPETDQIGRNRRLLP